MYVVVINSALSWLNASHGTVIACNVESVVATKPILSDDLYSAYVSMRGDPEMMVSFKISYFVPRIFIDFNVYASVLLCLGSLFATINFLCYVP